MECRRRGRLYRALGWWLCYQTRTLTTREAGERESTANHLTHFGDSFCLVRTTAALPARPVCRFYSSPGIPCNPLIFYTPLSSTHQPSAAYTCLPTQPLVLCLPTLSLSSPNKSLKLGIYRYFQVGIPYCVCIDINLAILVCYRYFASIIVMSILIITCIFCCNQNISRIFFRE